MSSRGYGHRPWGQYVGLLVLAMGTVALIVLAVTRDTGGPDTAADPPISSSPSPTAGSPSGEPAADPTPTDDPTLSTTPPTVPDQRRADFTAGDGLPDGALLVDGGGNESGLVLTDKGLTHGDPVSGDFAAGVLETQLDSDVRALGFRVRFAAGNPGALTLTGWESSIAAAVESGAQMAPRTGLRLVATPGKWTLSVIEDGGESSTLAEGTYDATTGPETFQVVRDEAQVFVTDPTGAVTTATDPRVAALAGPWASWGLQEAAVGEKPGVIEAVWGG